MKTQIPVGLPVNRSCFYELPAEVSSSQLKGYESEYKRMYASVFTGRVGRRFFFTLPTPLARDKFLLALEMGCAQSGFIVERFVLLYGSV